MATMTTRAIALQSKKLNKDIMKYARLHNYKFKEGTYKTKNNRTVKEYILNSKDAIKIIKRFNKSYVEPVKVKVPVKVQRPVRPTQVVAPVAPVSIIIPQDKIESYVNIYAKYASNSKAIRTVVLENLFKPASDIGMTPDQAFDMLVSTIDAFGLHDSISAFTYNLANSKVPQFKRKDRSYHNFLKSLYWSIIRNKQLQDHPVCAGCGTVHKLQIHHPDYKLIRRGTEYLHMNKLTTICDSCHKKLHNK